MEHSDAPHPRRRTDSQHREVRHGLRSPYLPLCLILLLALTGTAWWQSVWISSTPSSRGGFDAILAPLVVHAGDSRDAYSGTLKDIIQSPGGPEIWAAGDDGLVLTSTDEGQTWRQEKVLIKAEEFAANPIPEEQSKREHVRAFYAALDAILSGVKPVTKGAPTNPTIQANPPRQAQLARLLSIRDDFVLLVTPSGVVLCGKASFEEYARAADGTWHIRMPLDQDPTALQRSLGGAKRLNPTAQIQTQPGLQVIEPYEATASIRGKEFAVGSRQGYAMIWRSSDGWNHAIPLLRTGENQPSTVYPPPWYWIAVALLILSSFYLLRPGKPATVSAIDDRLVSDDPIASLAEDLLDFQGLVQGLCLFLRNAATGAPLTIAIDARWGSGKSSFMRMVGSDLRRHGIRTVWFNTWHQANENQLLSGLMQAIAEQAIPPALSWQGLAFRCSLAAQRDWRLRILALVFVAILGTCLLSLMADGNVAFAEQIGNDLKSLRAWFVAGSDAGNANASGLRFGSLVTSLVGLGMVGRSLIQAFPISIPGAVKNIAKLSKISDLGIAQSIRTQFATEFLAVTRALGNRQRIVIFIDDIDRCEQPRVMDALQSINFLVSAAPCYVVMGMDVDLVECQLAMAVKPSIEYLINTPACTHVDHPNDPTRAYAKNFLEKLVQLRLSLPVPTREGGFSLMTGIKPDRPSRPIPVWAAWCERSYQRTRRFVVSPVAQALLVFICALTIPILWHIKGGHGPANMVGPGASGPVNPALPPLPAPEPESMPRDYFAEFIGEHLSAQTVDLRHWTLPIFCVLMIITMTAMWLLRVPRGMVTDSDAFIRALSIWSNPLRYRLQTPRAIKRFQNELRYQAMQHRAFASESPWWMWLDSRLPGRIKTSAPAGSADPVAVFDADSIRDASLKRIGVPADLPAEGRRALETAQQEHAEAFHAQKRTPGRGPPQNGMDARMLTAARSPDDAGKR